jgi:hypothetical protein
MSSIISCPDSAKGAFTWKPSANIWPREVIEDAGAHDAIERSPPARVSVAQATTIDPRRVGLKCGGSQY